jgi:outer membrane protein OmpA-like peptidoglycan-associated protein
LWKFSLTNAKFPKNRNQFTMKAFAWILTCLYIVVALFVWMCPVRGHCPDAGSASDLGFSTNKRQRNTSSTIAFKTEPYSNWGSIEIAQDSLFQDEISSISKSLKTSDNQLLSIIGYAHPEELKQGSVNIGLGRAQALKQLLIDAGVAPDRMAVMYASLPDSAAKQGEIIKNPVLLRLVTLDKNRSLSLEKDIPAFHFEQNSSELKLDETRRAFLEQVILYLKMNSDRSVQLIGHTSLQGDEADNLKLGMERAQALKEYLVLFGAPDNQIKVDSRGEAEPLIAPEQLEADRRKNRRVELAF